MASTFTANVRFADALVPGIDERLAAHGARLWRPIEERGPGSRMLRDMWDPPPNTEDATIEVTAERASEAEQLIMLALGNVEFLCRPTVV